MFDVGAKVKSFYFDLKKILFLFDSNNFVLEDNPGIPHVETSAKAGSNVERAFESIVRSTLAQVKVSDDEIEFPPTVVLKEKSAAEPEKCRC